MKTSAGILMYRDTPAGRGVLLVHPGGPFWAKKDDGAWSIPKGEFSEGEDPLTAARREFAEELGAAVDGEFVALPVIRQKGGKVVHAWAVRGEFDVAKLKSNTFEMEWPPKSRTMRSFPEVDRAAWFDLDTARRKILPSQSALLDGLPG
ncbi:MAG TPA: NUDIX domain-containing protein [Candidatus Solibacter sp.]|nr:NUDIX domain-containing protein [Candidatus Solibacter sp.]